MTKEKDMTKVFQDRFRNFEEQPSKAPWIKLERRLEVHQRRNKLSFMRNFGMVAAILLLAVFGFVFAIFGDYQNADASIAATSVSEVETLSADDANPGAYEVMEFTLKYRDRMSNIVDEGAADQELIVRAN